LKIRARPAENSVFEAVRVGEAGENPPGIWGRISCQRNCYRARLPISIHSNFRSRWHTMLSHQVIPDGQREEVAPTAVGKSGGMAARQSPKIGVYIDR